MDVWLIDAKFYAILGFYLVLLITLLGFNAYVRQKTGQGMAGRLDFMHQVPARLRWLPFLASLASAYMLIYSVIFLVYPDIEQSYLPISALRDNRIAALGLGMLPVGTLILIGSQFQLGRSHRLNLPLGEVALVTRGLYAVSRNPLYLGLYIALLGIFLLIPDWGYLVCWVIFVINYHYKITVMEEPFLLSVFGESYRDYCLRVNRYF